MSQYSINNQKQLIQHLNVTIYLQKLPSKTLFYEYTAFTFIAIFLRAQQKLTEYKQHSLNLS